MDWQHEVWAEALWVEQNQGDHGPDFMAEQITRLALNGDEAGMARWERIAAAFDELRAGRVQ
jgi:hypothetical protein